MGIELHAGIERQGFATRTLFLGSALISMYANLFLVSKAQYVFDKLSSQDLVTWDSLILAYAEKGENERAVQLYEELQEGRLPPCKYVLSCALKACTNVGSLCEGRSIHDYLAKVGIDGDVVLGSSLIDIYGRSGVILEARRVFDKLPEKNVVCWGAIITSYTLENMAHGALEIFESMQEQTVKPDQVTLLCVLKACGKICATKKYLQLHDAIMIRMDRELGTAVGNALIDMYVKCGVIRKAHEVFDRLLNQDVVSWNARFAGYVDM
ncbi:hypothetical protein KP509_20G025400 [Ceratopteris richardii]|uniref:Pentatricopeptide repeat-containing protein n=1 Tax=Ceratopteris richardii TaxID=49495 RepID=A0A8T2SHE3_CERRI|nr:hypothetical protein KP509_20G025400 [Ceratopteris richardii]